MSAFVLRNRFQGNTTLIENDFIDYYMTSANGEFVKVYLLLLRQLTMPNISLSISQMADVLEMTESDIVRALTYWEKKGILSLERNASSQICGVEINEIPHPDQTSEPVNARSAIRSTISAEPSDKPQADTPKRSTQCRKEFQQILFIAERYLGKALSPTEASSIAYFYDTLNFSADLIEYLIEYCVENGHKSMHYIQKVALSWADENITTAEQARRVSALYNKTCYAVLNAFGIKGRGPATAELSYIQKWTDSDLFSLELILEACSRTMIAIHQPSFEYTDKILENWKTNQVRTKEDIKKVDQKFEQERSNPSQPKANRPAKDSSGTSKLRGFEEHSYDMQELTKELLGNK